MTDTRAPSPLEAELRAMPDPAYAKDDGLRFIAANDAFLEVFGLKREEIVGRTASEVLGIGESHEERTVLVLGARETLGFRHDGHDYRFRLSRRGSLAAGPLIVGRMRDRVAVSTSPAPPSPAGTERDDLRTLTHHIASGALLLSPTLDILAANEALYRVWRIGPDAFGVGDTFADFMAASRDSRANPLDDDAWSGHLRAVERDILNRNVPCRDIPLVGNVVLRASGANLSDGCSLLTFDDISLRDHSAESVAALEETARLSERLMRNLIDHVPVAIVVYDPDDNFLLDNRVRRAVAPLLDPVMRPGGTLADFLDRMHDLGIMRETDTPDIDALYDADPVAWRSAWLARYAEPGRTVEERRQNDRWFQVISHRLDDGYLIRVWTDISDLKAREKELDRINVVAQSSFRTLRAAIEAIPDGVAVWDKRDRLIISNREFADQFPGVTPRPGASVTELLTAFARTGQVPAAKGREEEWAGKRTAEWREALGREHLFETHDGRWIKAIDRRTVEGLRVGLRTDVTDLKRREIELETSKTAAETAERSKSEFLANMSHEIRTPMNGILGMAEILGRTELDERQQSFADVIVTSGNALLTIINDILDFSKIDAGQLSLHPEPFQLSRAIDDVATLLSTRSVEKDLEVIVRIAPGVPDYLIGDAGRLRQIVTNLMGNAVKFTEEGHVLVDIDGTRGARDAEGREVLDLVCRVVDTGIGIPEDRIDDVFSQFSQVDGSSTRQHEGTGLGLAIAKRLIELMGGEIGCESTVGKGSTFWFTIPLPIDTSARRPKPAPTDLTGTRVLVIDDNEVNRAILLEQLTSWGFDGMAASSGEEGIAILRGGHAQDKPIEAVILDYHMPCTNGTQVAEAVRADAALAGTPIVMLTSIDLDVTSPSFQALDLNGYLVKPARSSSLLKTVVAAIRQPEIRGMALAETSGEGKKEGVQEPVDRAGAHVLVADDNRVNQFVVREVLDALGLTCITADDGIEAVESYRDSPPCLVLMDVTMPKMDGHDATREIRRFERENGIARVPIVGATAHASDRDRQACLDSGMDDYISKPISPADLRETLRRWLTEEAEALSA